MQWHSEGAIIIITIITSHPSPHAKRLSPRDDATHTTTTATTIRL